VYDYALERIDALGYRPELAADVAVVRAHALFAHGRREEALETMKRSVAPRSHQATKLAQLLLLLDHPAAEALEVVPDEDSDDCLVVRGVARAKVGMNVEAIQDRDRLVQHGKPELAALIDRNLEAPRGDR